jgi:putative transcriptional regulator
MNIGQRVREVREAYGMPQAELARRVGVAKNTIWSLEAGRHTPSVPLLEKIAKELRTEPGELLSDPKAPAPTSPSIEAEDEEERRDHELREASGFASRELEHLKRHVRDCLARWGRVSRGEDPDLVPDYAYSIGVSQDAASYIAWFGTLLRQVVPSLPVEVALSEQREIIALIDALDDVSAEIRTLADAAAGVSEEEVDAEVQGYIDQLVAQYKDEPVDELEEKRRLRSERERRRTQQQADEVKRLAPPLSS